EIQGVPGKFVLRYNGGGALVSIEDAAGIRLTGLTLDGGAKPIDGGALLIAEGVKGLSLSECLIVGSAADGVVLRKVSGRITDCEIGDIRAAASSARTQRVSKSATTMCATAATTVSSFGVPQSAKTAPSLPPTGSSVSPQRAAAVVKTAMESMCFVQAR